MKITKITFILFASAFLWMGCSDIDSLQDDPNRTTNANPELLLTYLGIQAFSQNVSLSSALANRQMTYVDGADSYQYYTWQRGSFEDYDNLKQAVKMQEEAVRVNQNVYVILADFFKSYFITEITKQFGDVPFLEAAKLEEGLVFPVYDTQESIYLKVLEDLKNASLALNGNDEIISGDVVYGGDKLKWRKLINSFYLRLLMDLSLKDGESGLNLAARFQEIINNPDLFPIFESNEDAGVINYVNIVGNRYPLNRNNALQTAYFMEETFVERLVGFNDPRLFTMAEQTPNAVSSGLPVDDFNGYGGLLGSAPFSVLAIPATEGNASRINARYYEDAVNEPGVLMGYPELQFILAEAVERGWLAGNATEYYQNGIRASMAFYNITDNELIDAYLAQTEIQLGGSRAIEQIITQKHIALFLNSGWQLFYEQRRTGFPIYDNQGGGTGNNGQVPKRFLYPESENINNNENLEAAVSRQFSQGDNINGLMWLIN